MSDPEAVARSHALQRLALFCDAQLAEAERAVRAAANAAKPDLAYVQAAARFWRSHGERARSSPDFPAHTGPAATQEARRLAQERAEVRGGGQDISAVAVMPRRARGKP